VLRTKQDRLALTSHRKEERERIIGLEANLLGEIRQEEEFLWTSHKAIVS